ncbi:MAG: hypothetical protein JWQ23_4502 [Herminiimonas sp.]|nr:hypothetical protein [Herminiimonas sp.]
MPYLKRVPILLAMLMASNAAPAAANDSEFSGSWTGLLCPAGVQAGPDKCSSFVLALFQKQGKLCGSHVFATVGASQMDEGGVPSLSGVIANGTATVAVESSRAAPPVRLKGELSLSNGVLRWQRLDSPPGDYLLPMSAKLTRSPHGTLFSPLFEQRLSAACSSMLDTAAEPPRQNDAAPAAKPK